MGWNIKLKKRHPNNQLTYFDIKRFNKPGRYADGNNLYLLVEPTGSKRWILRLTVGNRRRDMGLGNIKLVSLKNARELAIHYKSQSRSGLDPFIERKKKKEHSLHSKLVQKMFIKLLSLA